MNIEILKKQKKKLGLTNAQVAEKSGISLGTINKVFAGEVSNPRIDTVRAIEKALDYPGVNYLETEQENQFLRETEARNLYANAYTVDDYRMLPGERRAELIDGQFYDMTAPYVSHQTIIAELYTAINDYIRNHNGNCRALFAPVDVQLDCDEYTMLEPDLMIICDDKKIKDSHIYGAPDWIAEVVSVSTRMRDYTLKAGKYMAAGVKEYWIVDYLKKKVTVYGSGGEDISFYSTDETIKVGIYPDLYIDMDRIMKKIG